MPSSRPLILAAALLLCVTWVAHAPARGVEHHHAGSLPAHGVAGVSEAQLSPQYWVQRLEDPHRMLMSAAAIAEQNARLLRLDDSMHDLRAWPQTTARDTITRAIEDLSALPARRLYHESGKPVPRGTLLTLVEALDLGAVADTVPTRYGLALRRTALRTFPTDLRVFSAQGDTDIDRFQESALFPGTAVAILHRSQDGNWLWVASHNYQAWVRKADIVEGSRAEVLAHAGKTPFRIVTGARVRTVFTPERPELSDLQLDMGVRLPLAKVAPDAVVNGQHSYSAWAIELPVRDAQGGLTFAPALLQKNQDTAPASLPLTQANIIGQAFKFLGERYGWGHDYNGRDCSGFVAEVYRSMGVEMPRNTSDQADSPALNHVLFGADDSAQARRKAVDALQVGDLIYIPGHVMMMIGRIDGAPYVIHDINGGAYMDASGGMRAMNLNAVSVTPLLPLRFNPQQTYVDRITSIVRIRP